MRRNQVGVVIDRRRIELITTRRLDADEGQAVAQAGDHHPPAAEHRVVLRLAPALAHCLLVGRRQAVEERQVVVQRQTLRTGAQVEAVEVVGDATEQAVDKRRAAVRQAIHRVTLGLQGAEDIQRSARGIQADPVANPPVTRRVVGKNQRNTFTVIAFIRKIAPLSRHFRDMSHARLMRLIAHHIALAALAAPGQALEADRRADQAPVQLR